MLNKRTQILFEDKTFSFLAALANREETSVGELVRKAVEKVYLKTKNNRDVVKQAAFANILRLKKDIRPISDKEIKEYINYGRQR